MIRKLPSSTLFPYTTLFRSLGEVLDGLQPALRAEEPLDVHAAQGRCLDAMAELLRADVADQMGGAIRPQEDRKSTRLNSSHQIISYAVFCLKKKKQKKIFNL